MGTARQPIAEAMPTYLQFEIHPASRRSTPGISACPVEGFRGAATVSFAVSAILTRFKTAPLDRTKLAYSHSTPKRLAHLVALVPVEPIFKESGMDATA